MNDVVRLALSAGIHLAMFAAILAILVTTAFVHYKWLGQAVALPGCFIAFGCVVFALSIVGWRLFR